MIITALLTGRGNNTFKNKNVKKIYGKPILYYPCSEAKKVKSIKNFLVSSEDKKILSAASKYGYEKILRPKKLSKPNSQHYDVLIHALKKINSKPDILVVLLANAPIIKKKWIEDCINILKKKKEITSVVPVLQDNDHHPLRAKKISKGYLQSFFKKNNSSSNRQALEKSFYLCHNFWVIRTEEIIKNEGEKPWSFMGKKTKAYVIKNSIDIHSKEDLEISKILMKID